MEPDPASVRTVTLIVHGTFAAEATWWRLGREGEATFADRLEGELSRRGLAGTVWRPALDAGLDFTRFAWSGRNRHRDRIRAGSRFNTTLNDLARRVGATPDEPLVVNLVAHSHGGNVVLEALRGLKSNIRVGRVVLLGTPLVTVKPAFRLGRFLFSTVLLAIFFLALLLLIIQLGTLFSTCVFGDACRFFDSSREIVRDGQTVHEEAKGAYIAAILIPMLIAYGWMFWLIGNFLDVAWRVICRIFEPLAWLAGRSRSRVYGPAPHELGKILGGKPVLLLTTRNDEADLLLQITSAPTKLYREYVATDFSIPGRFLEFVFLRPFVLGVFLKAGEMLLEVVSLGVSLWRSLFADFEVVPHDERPYYPHSLLAREEIDVRTVLGSAANGLVSGLAQGGVGGVLSGQQRGLRVSLQEVTDEIKKQIQLRHSMYYENPAVIQRIAEYVAGDEVRVPANAPRPDPLLPSSSFWEALLFANVALAAVYAWIAGTLSIKAFAAVIGGYTFPLAAVGIILLVCAVLRRPRPRNLRRWFWAIWASLAILYLPSAQIPL